MRVPPGADREVRIEAAFDAVGSAGGEDFEIVEDSDIVEVRLSIYLSFPVTLSLLPFAADHALCTLSFTYLPIC